jgi:hypothetical protein
MNSGTSIQAKLTEISSLCGASGFDSLLSIVTAYCDVTVACIELHRKNHLDCLNKTKSTDVPLLGLFIEAVHVHNAIGASISESEDKGLFQDHDSFVGFKGSKKTANVVAQRLHSTDLQGRFLRLLATSALALFAHSLLEDVHSDDHLLAAWEILVQSVRQFPALGRLLPTRQCKEFRLLFKQTGIFSKLIGDYDLGFKVIDLVEPIASVEIDAWGAWIQAGEETGQAALSLMEECVSNLRILANFILFVDTAPWPIAHFDTVVEGQSMSAIVRELCRMDLRPLTREDLGPIRKKKGLWKPSFDKTLLRFTGLCLFKKGVIRKHTYMVRLPDVDYLDVTRNFQAMVEYKQDPIEFTRRNWHLIPNSAEAGRLQSELNQVESSVLDTRLTLGLERSFSGAMEEVGPEAFAVFLVEASGLPHETSLLLSPIFRRVFKVLGRRLRARI